MNILRNKKKVFLSICLFLNFFPLQGEALISHLSPASIRNLEILKNNYPHFYEKAINDITFFLSSFETSTFNKSFSFIPKKIHFIWLGSENAPHPQIFDTWHKYNADYDIFLWTDQKRQNLPSFVIQKNISDCFPLQLHEEYEDTKDLKGKSWLLRYEILEKCGGIYADFDRECITSFNELLSFQFFASLAKVGPMMGHFIHLSNQVIGCIAAHPIIQRAILDIKKNWHRRKKEILLIGFCDEKPWETYAPLLSLKRLYLPLTESVLQIGLGEHDVIFPSYYFNGEQKTGAYTIQLPSSKMVVSEQSRLEEVDRKAKKTLSKCSKATYKSLYLSLSAQLIILSFLGCVFSKKTLSKMGSLYPFQKNQ